jgi:hypothetical protein
LIYNFRFAIWQAAVVLPHARQVLETRLRKLARGLCLPIANPKSEIANELVRLPGMGFPSLARWMPQIAPFALRIAMHPDHLPGRKIPQCGTVKPQPRN